MASSLCTNENQNSMLALQKLSLSHNRPCACNNARSKENIAQGEGRAHSVLTSHPVAQGSVHVLGWELLKSTLTRIFK